VCLSSAAQRVAELRNMGWHSVMFSRRLAGQPAMMAVLLPPPELASGAAGGVGAVELGLRPACGGLGAGWAASVSASS
jgi:hypothetical protein